MNKFSRLAIGALAPWAFAAAAQTPAGGTPLRDRGVSRRLAGQTLTRALTPPPTPRSSC